MSLLETMGPPKLHGDGVTDDTDAVQWYIDQRIALPDPVVGYRVDTMRLSVGAGMALMAGKGYSCDLV